MGRQWLVPMLFVRYSTVRQCHCAFRALHIYALHGWYDRVFLPTKPNHPTERSGTMSNPSGFAMALCKSASPPQNTSLNTVAVMATLTTDLRVPNLSIASPDRLTSLPVELLQQVASNLSPCSIMALRTTNKAAATKAFTNFVGTCLRSMTIRTTKVDVKQALEHLQIEGTNKAITHVTFMCIKSISLADIPSQAELKALLAQLPNATSITIRQNTLLSVSSWGICSLLTTTSTPLTELTIDGCALPGFAVLRLLRAHSRTLSYVALRNVHLLTRTTPWDKILTMLLTNRSLDRLVLHSLSEGDTTPLCCISDQALIAQRVPADYMIRAWTCRSGKPQQYSMSSYLASMAGTCGVRGGIRGILTGRFLMPIGPIMG
jgi:hypothetical protein